MGRRSRDSDSESDEYDSESDGYSDEYDSEGYDSESGSEDEEEMIKEALSSAGMKKYFKYFQKKGITSVADAQGLSDKKLSKFVKSSSDRKKILRALEDLDDGSESEYSYDSEDEFLEDVKDISSKYAKALKRAGITTAKKATKPKLKKAGLDSKGIKAVLGIAEGAQLAEALKAKGLKKYVKGLNKAKVLSKSSSGQEKVLKKLGASSGDKKKIMKILSKFSEESDSEEESDSDSEDEGETVKRLLAKAEAKKYIKLFQSKGVNTVAAARKLQHKDLREMGIHLYRERRDIIEEFEKYNGEELSSVSSGSDDTTDNVNMVHEVLRQQYMSRHIPDFDRMGITTLRQARKLTQTQLRSMGVALYLQRERLINAFADYRPKNKAIMKILIDCNLASHAREFEKLIDVEDAKNLTHSDLRAMGINLYGQRERLMRAFMEYKSDKKK
eukprot:augustus_masked-scaffold_23-processed-gene-5.54-mRNA-1 protein AED:0.11 eAED:1.00 QI:0/-1/0/1/-1/1/1/0/443